MNLQRFGSLPNALKPAVVALVLLAMILAGAGRVKEGASTSGGWFLWLTLLLQFVCMTVVVGLFAFEAEALLTFGRDAWPVIEMAYSATFFLTSLVDMFIVASWNRVGVDGTFLVAGLFLFLVTVMHAFAGVLMFRIWKGFVRSGAAQNPTGNVQPGNVGSMHPGI